MRGNALFLLVLANCLCALTFNQDDYIVFTDFIRKNYNLPSYLTDWTLKFGHFNRSTKVLNTNGRLLKTLIAPRFKVLGEVFVYVNNEYRSFIPMRMMLDMCHALKANLFGVQAVKENGNITDCPLKPGIYAVNNYVFDSSKFPPNLPPGQFKVIITFYEDKTVFGNLTIFSRIVYKSKKP